MWSCCCWCPATQVDEPNPTIEPLLGSSPSPKAKPVYESPVQDNNPPLDNQEQVAEPVPAAAAAAPAPTPPKKTKKKNRRKKKHKK